MGTYQAPSVLRRWASDVPGGDFHELTILSSEQVCMASGRYAHSSGSACCTWIEFVGGALNALAAQRLGQDVVEEALAYISSRRGDDQMERVFVVQHKHTLPEGVEDWKMIGVYRTHDGAKAAVDRLSVQPGFARHPHIIDPNAPGEEDGFYVSEHLLDRDDWGEGFVTMIGDRELED